MDGGAALVGGVDECGRGALSGPVTVSVAVVSPATGPVPDGITDSKATRADQRDALADTARDWSEAWAVGHASAAEIDEHGIVTAMRYAAWRALAQLPRMPDVIILDGPHDYITARQGTLFDTEEPPADLPRVVTQVKADASCASVAAASIIGKSTRDQLMRTLASSHPEYGWDTNCGYGTRAHQDAIATHGITGQHRRTWITAGS